MSSHSTYFVRLVSLALTGAMLAGCAQCGEDGPRVPFKLSPPKTGSARDAGAAGPTRSDVSASTTAVQFYPTPVDQPSIDGSALPVPGVRATIVQDLDGDGDRDVLAVVDDPSSRARLIAATREPQGFISTRDVPGFAVAGDASCKVTAARIDPLSTGKAVATLELSCGDPPKPRPPSYTLFSLELTPRVYERIDLLSDPDGVIPLALTPSSLDADSDGHDDVVLSVSLMGALAPEDSLKLLWLDRPSGLARDVREPEATLSAWASAAQNLVAKAPDQAIARATLVLTLARALCREQGAPALSLSGAPGIPCGSSKGTAEASLALVHAHAKSGHVREAFDAYRELRRAPKKPDARSLDKAYAALSALPGVRDVSLRRGPAVELASTPHVRLPSVRFVSETTLYVRRSSPVLYDLDSGQESAVSVPSDDIVRDPSGQLAITAIERGCAGYTLRVERAPGVGSHYLSTPPVSRPVLLALASAPGCTSLPGAQRGDDGGFRVLGWAPQGVVAARGSEVRVVPLSLDGKPSGEPRALEPSTPRPAPLPSGTATPDGSRYVELTPFGVLVFGPDTSNVELWRPEGYENIGKDAVEVAISPLGKRVAVSAGGMVYVLERGGSGTAGPPR